MSHEMQVKDEVRLDAAAPKLMGIGLVAGVVGLGIAGFLAMGGAEHFARVSYAYLVNYVFFLSVSLGCLFFVILHHLVRAGWSVVVRRVAEILAAIIPILAVLSLPIIIPM